MKKIFYTFVYVTIYLLTIIFLCYFIGIHIADALFQEIISSNFMVLIDDATLRKYFLIYFLVIILIILLLNKFNKSKFISIYSLGKAELFFYGLNAYLLTYFFSQELKLSKLAYFLFQIILFVIFFLILPQIVKYYLNFNPTQLKSLLIKVKLEMQHFKKNSFDIKKILPSLFSLFIFTSFAVLMTVLITRKVNSYLEYQHNLTKKIYIKNISPLKTTIGEKVTIKGYNFGFRENEFFQVKTTLGSINDIKDWNDNQVVFLIPLDFKAKEISLWLERTKETSTQSALLKSNKVNLSILPRWDFYPEEINFDYPPNFFSWFEIPFKKIKRFFLLRFNVGF